MKSIGLPVALTAAFAVMACVAVDPTACAQQVDSMAAESPAAESQVGAGDAGLVVVTGVASGGKLRKLDSAFSITTASAEQIQEARPSSTADMFKIVPGVTPDPTGGQTGANIYVRGFPSNSDAPFVTLQVNGAPVFASPTLSFLANDSTFRIDDTIERVEVLRGGPSVLYSNGQPGMTMNFLLLEGSEVPQGSVRLTTGTGNLERVDAFYGGKLADGWYASIGGFRRVADGIRNGGFPADDGGSLSATLTHTLADGKLLFYARATDDKNAFYTSLPVMLQSNGSLSTFAGINPLTWTPLSNATRYFTLPDGQSGDLAQGRGARNLLLGADLERDVGGWRVLNRLDYFRGDQPTIAMFSGPSVVGLGAQIAALAAAANANPALLAAAGRAAVSGSAAYAGSGQPVGTDTETVQFGLWDVDKRVQSLTEELRLTKGLFQGHTVTGGIFLAHYSSDDLWNLGNDLLMDVAGNPIRVTLDNGVEATNPNGFTSGTTTYVSDRGVTSNYAVYLADEWAWSERLKLDAGVRYEVQNMNFAIAGTSAGYVGSDPLAMFNYGTVTPNGTSIAYDEHWTLPSFTFGGIYKLRPDASLFARINRGGQFPYFDQVRGSAPELPPPVTRIEQAELGFKAVTPLYSVYGTLFANQFDNQFQYSRNFAGVPQNTIGGSRAYGVEYELALRPLRNFQVVWSGDVLHARYRGYDDQVNPGINGNMIQGQPASQWRLTPSYLIPIGDDTLKLYGTYSFFGAHWDDQQNTDHLPGFYDVDAGALYRAGEHWEFRLSALNLTNQVGLIQGSVGRAVAVAGSAPYATTVRTLFGRDVQLSVKYSF
ncbi:MAG: TonB-dependent receptor [Burkholderiaceae bacterium]|nr:TonB-dependent receptor [Burkholderiaceae bacterium]